MTQPYLLAIDNGTQSVRALLFDLHGTLVDKAQVPITPNRKPHRSRRNVRALSAL